MTNSHLIDYVVITAADLTALALAWLAGRGWVSKKVRQISDVNWKTGHLYWLGSDLMWTWTQVNAGNIARINHGLDKAVHHASSLGLGEPILPRIKTMQTKMAGKQSLDAAEKHSILAELDEVISQVGKLAEANQPDFKADPER